MANEKEKLNEIIKKLEETKNKNSKIWKEIIKKNEEEFNKIKNEIKERQEMLRDLISKKDSALISKKEFEMKLDKIQDELSDLEMKIYKMRLNR
ncbi:MAG: hypothetical protein EAX96_00465 [Candidatus Lokiarchaeota archaeon]|nr:hypothetical protein [Candidatus Lokiarchaeota archaeon]